MKGREKENELALALPKVFSDKETLSKNGEESSGTYVAIKVEDRAVVSNRSSSTEFYGQIWGTLKPLAQG